MNDRNMVTSIHIYFLVRRSDMRFPIKRHWLFLVRKEVRK